MIRVIVLVKIESNVRGNDKNKQCCSNLTNLIIGFKSKFLVTNNTFSLTLLLSHVYSLRLAGRLGETTVRENNVFLQTSRSRDGGF